MNCHIDKELVCDLISTYESPLYVFHSDEFISNYNSLLNCIRNYYPNYNIAYSFKTNYTPQILKLVRDLGGLAEVVSDMEFNLARKIGYDYSEIIYNGPLKGDGLFEQLRNGGTVNIDSLDELDTVIKYARCNPHLLIRIAFRVNIDIGQGFISRFGLDSYENKIDDTNSELQQAFNLANENNIRIVGIHCHVGRSRGIEEWKNRVRIVFALLDRYFDNPPEFIDFGSGMNSVMEPELANQFGDSIPSFNDYAEVIGKAMYDRYGHLPNTEQPILYTEPGTTLVSGCMSFLSTVKTIKTVKGKTFATFDCTGGNMGDICHLKNLPITIYHLGSSMRYVKNSSFVGYTCLEHDHIFENYEGKLAVGDVVQFRNIGSYSNVFKPPFILPNCAMIELKDSGHSELIKRKETMDDLFQTYLF